MVQQTNSWGEVTSELMNTWMETSTQTWKGWLDMMGAYSPQKLMEQSKPDFQDLNQRFLGNQELMLRFLKLSFKAWQDIIPKVETGQDWQQVMLGYSEQMRSQVEEFSLGTLKVSRDASQLWQLYLKEVQKLSQLWTASLGSFFQPMSKAMGGTTEPWIELNNLYWNLLYEESFGSLMQSPILGPTREFTGKILRGYDAWVTLYRASLDYQVVLADIQVRSFEALIRELVSLAEKGEIVKDLRQFQQIWSRVADDVFEKAFCNDENLRIRGRFINALNIYRVYQQDLRELWMQSVNIPSRREVDEIHKTIYELRKEVKTLKKTLVKYENQAS